MTAIENRRRMRGQGGFTLIELLVVIAILGVLAAVVVFAVGGINNTSKESACEIDKRTVSTAAQAYFAQENDWAASEQALVDAGFLEDLSSSYDYAAPAAGATAPAITAQAGNANGCT